MKHDNAKVSKALKEYIEFGGITGQETPQHLDCIPAKIGNVVAIAFDPERHKCEEHPDPFEKVLTAYTVKSKDGREAYIEVKGGKLYALVSKGLNIEIWRKMLVIGTRSDGEVEAAKRASKRKARAKL